MHVFALNCTLKPLPEPSSTDVLLDQIADELSRSDVKMDRRRIADSGSPPG